MPPPYAEHPRALGRPSRIAVMIVGVIYAAISAAICVILNRADIALVDTLDKHLGDWRIALGSPRAPAQRADIAIVLIAEETLLDYESRSPIDRALLAELVRAIDAAGPKAIGLDLIFDRRTRHDARLIGALKQAKAPVVLGNVDKRIANIPSESLAIQREFLAATGRPYGHLMLGRRESLLESPDSVVRYIAHPDTLSTVAAGTRASFKGRASARSPKAFVDAVVEAAGIPARSAPRLISWLRPPDTETELFATLVLPRHRPEDVKPGLEGLFSPSWRALLKDRIVLIGATMIDRDQHATPLSVLDRSRMPGVLIQAQALAQRIDGNRDIWELPDWLVALVSGVVALACFLTARHTGLNPHGLAYGLAGIVLIGTASFLAFWRWHIDFPSVALATAWVLGGFGGFVSNWFPRRGDAAPGKL